MINITNWQLLAIREICDCQQMGVLCSLGGFRCTRRCHLYNLRLNFSAFAHKSINLSLYLVMRENMRQFVVCNA